MDEFIQVFGAHREAGHRFSVIEPFFAVVDNPPGYQAHHHVGKKLGMNVGRINPNYLGGKCNEMDCIYIRPITLCT